ncbi:sugar-binding transcriptional regulator [Paenibacillus rigui]|uniref:MarR family transcriptional regulator n=1 Tax=Paenibacillus rigui TaxID=554312 RepID=A0A229UNA8_9BACL|nr:sugar-binding transcriptional regulator [Paenibacillus rigui]OXM84861.1 MarR family transcriptional regulator [Paenibacillus rigui]
MTDIKSERNRLLVKISQLYYEEGLNQQDIAARLGMSRPHVSRMLTAAKQEGIVQITIKNPYSAEQQVERALLETFGIHDALVVDASQPAGLPLSVQLGRTCAVLLESILKDHDTVGIMAGRTVAAVGTELDYFPRNGLQFVPLVGGWGSEGASWHANSNTATIADKLKSKYWQLHAPAVVTHEQTGKLLKQEPDIDKVLQQAKRCQVAVIGIGEVSEHASIVQSGNFTSADLDQVKAGGAAANLCASFLDGNGQTIALPVNDRMIGLTAQELRGIPNVVAVAGGQDKVAAITAALRGKWIDILVTDAATAEAVLRFHAQLSPTLPLKKKDR